MKRRNEEEEEEEEEDRVDWKKLSGLCSLFITPNKMSDLFSSLTLSLCTSISGSNQLSDGEPIFFCALKFIA